MTLEMFKDIRRNVERMCGSGNHFGPAILYYAMSTHHAVSISGVRQLMKSFEEIKLTDSPGENVSEIAQKATEVTEAIEKISSDGAVPADAPMAMMECFRGCGEQALSVQQSQLAVKASRGQITESCDERIGSYLQANAHRGNLVAALAGQRNDYPTSVASQNHSARVASAGSIRATSVNRVVLRRTIRAASAERTGILRKLAPKGRARKAAPKPGEATTKEEDGKTWYFCATCRRWNNTHTTKEHVTREERDQKKQAKENESKVKDEASTKSSVAGLRFASAHIHQAASSCRNHGVAPNNVADRIFGRNPNARMRN